MFRRYPNANVMEMPVEDGISLLSFAFGKEEDDKLYSRWINAAQYEMGFDEFKRQLMPAHVNEKKTIEDLDRLMEQTVWGKVPIRSE